MSPWIDVTIALPDDGEHVLVWSPRVGCMVAYRDGRDWLLNGREFLLSGITHWMELPCLPEGGK